MTLPKNGTPWPPVSAQTEKLAEWSAWYSGDPTELGTFYGSRNGAQAHPNQFRGGVVGKLARWWWGVPVASGESAAKLHVPLAADICGTSADLLFSEPVQLTSLDSKASEFLADLQEDGLDTVLHESAEVAAAMSGVYLRTVWDTKVSPRPWTEAAHPDGAVPTWRGGRLQAVTLWSELPKVQDGVVHRLLERHEVGAIEYGLYAGTGTNLGKSVPLQDHPDTEHLALLVNEDGVQVTNLRRLAVVYVPNMRPNRLFRNSPEGRSDLQGVEPWLDALDEAYSSWWRDIRHAKSRIHLPASMLEQTMGPGTSGVADVDREVYVPLEGVLASSSAGLKDSLQVQQFEIRVTEHLETCKAWTERIIESAGYSAQSLAGDDGGAQTATEVRSHERRSYMTRGKKARYWTKALREHLAVQLEVGAMIGAGVTAGAEFKVEFPDGVQESTMQLAQTSLALRNAEAASTRTRVQMLHPDWDQKAVDAEVSLILAETGGGEPVAVPGDAGF